MKKILFTLIIIGIAAGTAWAKVPFGKMFFSIAYTSAPTANGLLVDGANYLVDGAANLTDNGG